jgi:hypothetical protein
MGEPDALFTTKESPVHKAAARPSLAALVGLACALAPAALAAAPAADKDQGPTAVEKVRQALEAPVTVKIDKQPLTAAIDMLKEKGKVNLVLDTLSIQQQLGWVPEQPPAPVDVDLKDVKLKSALRTVLGPYSLSYVVLDDTVLVTTEQTALLRQMSQRVNVDLDQVEFGQALKQLGRETGANLLLDSRVDKDAKVPVSLELEDVPLETAVRLLSEMAGLKPVRIGNVLFVTDKKTAAELRADPDLGQPIGQPTPDGRQIYTLSQGAWAGGFGGNVIIAQPTAPVPAPGVAPAVPPLIEPKKAEESGDKPGASKDDKKDGDK